MKIYRRVDSHLLCGHWNGSPVEIGLTGVMKSVPRGDVPLEAGTVVMPHPGERHRVSWVDPEAGIQWVIIKERSAPDSKVIAEE